MQFYWIETRHGTWRCQADQYQGTVNDLQDAWLARVEDGRTSYPATMTFHSLREAQAWVEQKLIHLICRDPA